MSTSGTKQLHNTNFQVRRSRIVRAKTHTGKIHLPYTSSTSSRAPCSRSSPTRIADCRAEAQALDLRTLLLPFLLLLIPKKPPEDLARGALGDDIDELDTTRQPLVAGLVLLDELDDVATHEGVRVLDADRRRFHHVCFGDFAGAFVRDGNHSAVGDGRVVEEEGFEFSGRDLEALGLDIVS
jgi:hypothetical protein